MTDTNAASGTPVDDDICGHPCEDYFELGSCRCTGYENMFDDGNDDPTYLGSTTWRGWKVDLHLEDDDE